MVPDVSEGLPWPCQKVSSGPLNWALAQNVPVRSGLLRPVSQLTEEFTDPYGCGLFLASNP